MASKALQNIGGSFYVVGGTLARDALCYVSRKADTDLIDGLRRGQYCYVLTSRQMGKSSLMVRTAARLREEGVAVAVLDLTAIGQNLTPDQWYNGLLNQVGQHLDLEEELEEFWFDHAHIGRLQRFQRALRDVVLPRVSGSIVLFVDEVDSVRSLNFSTDEFFAGIRECYNRRPEDPELKRLTFCLLGVATPNDLVRDSRTTPFNIGTRIELRDFAPAEAEPLALGLRRESVSEDGARRLLERVLHWTGGHPYLTQRLCRAVAEDPNAQTPADVDRHCEDLFLSNRARETDDNLLFVRRGLLQSDADLAALLHLYYKVQQQKRVPDDEANPLVSTLKLSGVVRVEDGVLQVRNRIYAHVFNRPWIIESMPGAELRRQREAYLRGVLRTVAISGLVVAGVGGLAYYGFANARRASALADLAEKRRIESERNASLAQREANRANALTEEVKKQRDKALDNATFAEIQTMLATEAQEEAEKLATSEAVQKRKAELQSEIARQQKERAMQSAKIARASERAAQDLAKKLAIKTEQANASAKLATDNAEQANKAVKEAAEIAFKLGRIYLYQEQLANAQDTFSRALNLYQRINDKPGCANSLYYACETSLAQKDYTLARVQGEKSLELYRDTAVNQPREQARCLNALGAVYANLGDWDDAEKSYKDALALREKLGVPVEVGETLASLGRFYFQRKNYDESIQFFNRALTLQQKNGAPKEQATTLYSLGEVCAKAGKLEQAQAHYAKALEMREQQNDATGMLECLDGLGEVCDQLKQWQQARDYRKRAELMRGLLKTKPAPQSVPMQIGNLTPQPPLRNGEGERLGFALIAEKSLTPGANGSPSPAAWERGSGGEGDAPASRRRSAFYCSPQAAPAQTPAQEPPAPAEPLAATVAAAPDNYDTLRSLGIAALVRGEYKVALDYFLRSLQVAEKENNGIAIAKALNNVGAAYAKLEQYDDALSYYQRALEAYKKFGMKETYSYLTHFNIGEVYFMQRHWEKAIEKYLLAQKLCERGDEENTGRMAMIRRSLGRAYRMVEKWDAAREEYEEALELYQKVGEPRQIAEALQESGDFELHAGEALRAIPHYQRALRHWEQIGDPVAISETNRALGEVCVHLASYDRASHFYVRALQSAEQAQSIPAIVQSRQGFGVLLTRLGEYAKAQTMLLMARETLEKQSAPLHLARVASSLGVLYDEMGQAEKAQAAHAQSLAAAEEAHSPLDEATALRNWGRSLLRGGDANKALGYLERAKAKFEENGAHAELTPSLMDLGEATLALGRFEQAEAHFSRAFDLQEHDEGFSWEAYCLDGLARVHVGQKDYEAAQTFFQQALAHLNAPILPFERRRNAPFPAPKQQRIYAHYADLLVLMKRPGEALKIVEQGRVRELLQRKAQGQMGLDRLILLGGEGKLFTPLAQNLFSTHGEAPPAPPKGRGSDTPPPPPDRETPDIPPPPDAEELQSKVFAETERALAEAQRQLEKMGQREDGRRSEFRFRFEKMSATGDLTTLTRSNPDTLFIEWAVVNDERILVFALSAQERVRAFALPLRESELRARIETWRKEMRGDGNAEIELARGLYQVLFAPMERAGLFPPGRYARLTLVADGVLQSLPFAALLDGKGQRLIERFTLSQSAALATLNWSAPRPKADLPLLAVADPFKGAGASPALMQMTPLTVPFAEEQCKAVLELYPRGTAFFGNAVQEPRLRQQMPRFDILHFATPAVANTANAQRSYLMAAPMPGMPGSGLLRAGEIAGMRLAAQMVVLAGCASSNNPTLGDEGPFGLAWAFRAAGVPSVVSSQWIIEDEASKTFMATFYKGLKDGKRKDDALREAMLTLKKQKAQPYYWAAFQLLGDTGALTTGNPNRTVPAPNTIPRPGVNLRKRGKARLP